jgi:hypothetical protein
MDGLQHGVRVEDQDVYGLIAQAHLQAGRQGQASFLGIRQAAGQFNKKVYIATTLAVVDSGTK